MIAGIGFSNLKIYKKYRFLHFCDLTFLSLFLSRGLTMLNILQEHGVE